MSKLRLAKISKAVEMACLLEVSSNKPGNVTPTCAFEDLDYLDFLHCAVTLGKVFRESGYRSVGDLILQSIKGCLEASSSNANLGIVLLFAPMALAYYKKGRLDRDSVKQVLVRLTKSDAKKAYQAIRLCNPSGLNKVKSQSVNKDPDITLLRAMKMSANRDWIAYEYANSFEIVFEKGLPELELNIEVGLIFRDAIVHTYLKLLYLYPDSLVSRKTSIEEAHQISNMAGVVLDNGGVTTDAGRKKIMELDSHLRSNGNTLNPGSTADLTASSLFVFFMKHGYNELSKKG
ncbi:MAG TPA: triphosphoribosyl-dephospho-CoA synthase [Nitrospinota bacterium]|jgi:triphosphoribosyl-dephospho-CoA synthase|nr:triphosphoribosyl-dephospho-CoA synthase [Nitrospinota bacterium]|tara:strand:- start:8653 stop:9522 length:870 start_codon:yes stop_codon:yes gene_type:complete